MRTEVPTITLNNGVEIPALGLGVFQTPPDETRERRRGRPRHRLPPHRHRRRLRQRARGRRGGRTPRGRPRGGLPGDQDLDQRLRLRRDPARLRQERRQARRRPDRPADPAPGPAVGVRQDPGGLPGAGEAARRRQGPRHRRQQLHGRPPHPPARHGHGRARRSTRSRCTPTSSSARSRRFGAEHGILTQAWSPIGGITFYRDGEHTQHPGGPGHRPDRRGPRQEPGPGDAALAPAAGPLGHPEVDQAAPHRRELRRLRLRAHRRRARRHRRPGHRQRGGPSPRPSPSRLRPRHPGGLIA